MSLEVSSPSSRAVAPAFRGVLALVVFGVALFSSAFLLFWIEPLFARMALPRLGGSEGVWNTCLVFFQASLLLGYTYAHVIARYLSLRGQVLVHLAVLAVGAAFLPIAMRAGWAPPADGSPVLPLLALLTLTLGWPFFALSANAPLLQHWFSFSDHKHAANPYVLYAASNAGSLTALLAYPFLLEPQFTLSRQSALWSLGFFALMAMIAIAGTFPALRRATSAQARAVSTAHTAPVSWRMRLTWIVYAAIPSSLLLGVTGYVTTDIASIPLLWIAPLALYLLTFVLIFAARPPIPHAWMIRALPGAIVLAAFGFWLAPISLAAAIAAHFTAFFIVAMACHGELARLRPPVDRLTEFYFWMSLGGVVGGALTALVSPLVFNGIIEYPLVLGLACLVQPERDGDKKLGAAQLALLAAAILIVLVEPAAHFGPLMSVSLSLWAIAMIALFAFQPKKFNPASGARGLLAAAILIVLIAPAAHFGPLMPMSLSLWAIAIIAVTAFQSRKFKPALVALALLLDSFVGHTAYTRDGTVIWRGRSFYGAYVVTQDDTHGYRMMFHGTTAHGVELLKAPPQPLTYYGRGGPLGDVMRVLGPNAHSVAAVGLGIGSVACYARAGQSWTFFEIDGLVDEIAARSGLFRELPQCAPQAKVILGDGRLSLERGAPDQYDLLILDAFSSDAIPVHLVTREAFASYLRTLKPHGAIALHITNRYFDLAPIIARIAPEAGLVAYDWDFRPPRKTDSAILSVSHWIVLARSPADLGSVATDGHWTRRLTDPKVRLWTDDYSNLLAALR